MKTRDEFGNCIITLRNYTTHYHIKDIGLEWVLLEDSCPKDKSRGCGDTLKIAIDSEDKDDIDFREYCKRMVINSKKNKCCPEIHIHCEIGASLDDLRKSEDK